MITIDNVGEQGYSFPTIDFKFQNSGNATAFLWQFALDVQMAEIDVTPVLDFRSGVENGQLQLIVTNNGWGVAQGCSIIVQEPTLNQIFGQSSLRFNGTLDSGQSDTCLCLSTSEVSAQAFQALERHFAPLIDERRTRYSRLMTRNSTDDLSSALGIKLEEGQATCQLIDERGAGHTLHRSISFADYRRWIALTRTGFVEFIEPPPCAAAAGSDTTYISLIDPHEGPHERTYAMSRKVPPGDIERFHIMVGASKSCRLKLRFKFFVDKDTVVESDQFDIHIFLPRSQTWTLREYRDGSELAREVDILKRQMAGLASHGQADYMADWRREKIQKLESQASTFPFLQDRRY